MATLTIRKVPGDVVERLKASASRNHRSMEQEVRELLKQRFPTRQVLEERVRERWSRFGATSQAQIDEWIEAGRRR